MTWSVWSNEHVDHHGNCLLLFPQVLLVKWVNVSMLTLIQHRHRSSSSSRLVDICWDEPPKSSEEVFLLLIVNSGGLPSPSCLLKTQPADIQTRRRPSSPRRQPLILAEFLQANYLLAHSTQTTHTPMHTHTENINGVWKTPSDQFSFEQKQTTGCLRTSIRAQCVSEVDLYLQTGEHITAVSNATAHRSRTYHQPRWWLARGGTCINSQWETVSRTPADRSLLVSHSVLRMDVSVWIFTTPDLPSVPTISPQVRFYSWCFSKFNAANITNCSRVPLKSQTRTLQFVSGRF